MGTNPSKWLMIPRPQPKAGTRLFCFHHAGGAAHLYWSWPAAFAPEVEVVAVQLPGRGNRLAEDFESSFLSLIPKLSEGIQPALAEKPFVFFGHSMGGLVAFELARRLGSQGEGPRRLFISACRAAHIYSATKRVRFSELTDDDLLRHMKILGGTPPELLGQTELMAHLIKVLRADYRLLDHYVFNPEPRLKIPLTLFGGTSDPEVIPQTLAAWSEINDATTDIESFPGGHFYFRGQLPLLSARILARLR